MRCVDDDVRDGGASVRGGLFARRPASRESRDAGLTARGWGIRRG